MSRRDPFNGLAEHAKHDLGRNLGSVSHRSQFRDGAAASTVDSARGFGRSIGVCADPIAVQQNLRLRSANGRHKAVIVGGEAAFKQVFDLPAPPSLLTVLGTVGCTPRRLASNTCHPMVVRRTTSVPRGTSLPPVAAYVQPSTLATRRGTMTAANTAFKTAGGKAGVRHRRYGGAER